MNWVKKIKIAVIAIIVLVLIGFYIPRAYRGEVEVLVTGKERITYKRDAELKSKYLIYTKDEVFENVDSWLYFKFNSSDFYGRIKEGQKYRFVIEGWRIPMFSKYRNIIALDRIIEDPSEEESKDLELENHLKLEDKKEENPIEEPVKPVAPPLQKDTIKKDVDFIEV